MESKQQQSDDGTIRLVQDSLLTTIIIDYRWGGNTFQFLVEKVLGVKPKTMQMGLYGAVPLTKT